MTLGPRAHAVLRDTQDVSPADLNRLRHSYVPMFWRHDAQCRDFRLTLELACERSSAARLVEWIDDRELKHQPPLARSPRPVRESGTSVVALVPDAVFKLARPVGDAKRFFLEIDRATEVSPLRFERKLKEYARHRERLGGPVLFVVPDEPRRAQIIRWIEQGASTATTSFATTLANQITEATIVHSPIWQVVGESRPQPLVPAGPVGNRLANGGPSSDEGEPWKS